MDFIAHVYICILAWDGYFDASLSSITGPTTQIGPQSCLGPNQQHHLPGMKPKHKLYPSSIGQPDLTTRPVPVPGDTPGARAMWTQDPSAHAKDLLLLC